MAYEATRAEDHLSLQIAALFADVFNLPSVRPDDDFFRLGGDSLVAESLILAIEQKFGSTISAARLLEASSPRSLAALVRETMQVETDGCLITIRAEGRGPPLFCLHGLNGHITYGQSLRTVFGPDRPIYALRARGLQPGEPVASSIGEFAADYLREIRRVRRHGPYLLLAPCGPSMIAFEMAQRLVEAGETVPGLVMADPGVLANDVWLRQSGLARALLQTRASTVAAHATAMPAGASPDDRRRVVTAALGAATRAYSPQPYRGGAVLLIYSHEWAGTLMDPARGFPALVGNLRAVEVTDTHLTLQNDFRGAPAAAIRAFLDDVAPIAGL
jgi:acyl carrier protein